MAEVTTSKTSSILRCVLSFFNFLFAAIGLSLIAVGVIVQLKYEDYFQYVDTVTHISIPVLFIVLGCVVLLISLCGCLGAFLKNTCLLVTYSVLLLVSLICFFAVGTAVFAFETRLMDILEFSMTKSFDKYNDGAHSKFSKSWNHLQRKFMCCGVNSSLDYEQKDWGIPDSCCDPTKPNTDVVCEVFKNGCSEKVYEEAKDNMIAAGCVFLSMAFIQILGVVFACCLARDVRTKYSRLT